MNALQSSCCCFVMISTVLVAMGDGCMHPRAGVWLGLIKHHHYGMRREELRSVVTLQQTQEHVATQDKFECLERRILNLETENTRLLGLIEKSINQVDENFLKDLNTHVALMTKIIDDEKQKNQTSEGPVKSLYELMNQRVDELEVRMDRIEKKVDTYKKSIQSSLIVCKRNIGNCKIALEQKCDKSEIDQFKVQPFNQPLFQTLGPSTTPLKKNGCALQ